MKVVIEVAGLKLDSSNNMVITDTKPVDQRFYYSSRLPESISCYDSHMQLFQNVELFSPVIYDIDNPIPTYNNAWEVYDNPNSKKRKIVRINYPAYYLEWWYEQRRRCIDGYTAGGVFITGAFYFYLNFWRIKVKGRGKGMKPPRFLDLDKEFYDLIEKARNEDCNLLALKRRQIGFSEKLASLCGLELLLYPSAQVLIVAGLDEYAATTFNKMISGIDALSPYSQEKAGREFSKRKLKHVPTYVKLGFEVAGIAKGYLSEAFAITTKDNVQAASGKAPTFVFMEESGINPLLKRVYNMILPSVQEGGKQHGRIIVIVGTGGEMKKGVADMMSMFYNPKKYNLLAVPNIYEPGVPEGSMCCPFFAAWWYYVTDNDGNSYKEAGLELIQKKRKLIGNDKKELHENKTQMPITPSEAFSSSGGSPFNTDKLEKQLNHLLLQDWENKIQWGRFDEILADGRLVGVKWSPAPTGMEEALDHEGDFLYPVQIIEHPDRPNEEAEGHFDYMLGDDKIEGLYGGGTDSYDKDEANTSDSQGSFSVMKGYHNASKTSMLPVCRLTWRPTRKEKFYKMTALGCIYYGECENLIEWSNISIFDWYKSNDLEELLKERPEISYANVKDSKVNNRYGIDPNTKSVWIEHFSTYVEDYSTNFYDFEMVKRLIDFKSKDHNCDITIAIMLAYEGILDSIKKGFNNGKEKRVNTSSRFVLGFSKQNGRLSRL